MSEVTQEQALLICGCLGVLLALPVVFAVVGLYQVWRRYFHRQPISSSDQRIKLLGWLLLVGLVIAYSVFWLRVFFG